MASTLTADARLRIMALPYPVLPEIRSTRNRSCGSTIDWAVVFTVGLPLVLL